jgi:hypothetical protein
LKTAVFEKIEPERLKYRCILHPSDSYLAKQKYFEECRQGGWTYVDDHWNLMVFYASLDADDEILRFDPRQPITYLKKSIRNRIIGCTVFILLLGLLYYLMCSNPGVFADSLLNNDIIFLYAPVLFLTYVVFRTISFIMMFSELKRRKRCTKGNQEQQYRKTLTFARPFGVAFLLLMIFAVFPFWRNAHIYNKYEELVLPKGTSIITTTDIAEHMHYTISDKGDFFCKITHGMLFPDQITEIQAAFAEDKDDGGGSIDLQYNEYRATMPWLASLLAEQLAEEYSFYSLTEQEKTQGFDKLWLSDWILIAVSGDRVYLVDTYSSVPPKDVVPILRAKMQEKAN